MLDRPSELTELHASIANVHKRIEKAKSENDRLRASIQASLHEKGGSALSEAILACTKANITAHTLQEQLVVAQKKVAVKDDILLPLKAEKLERANEKNSERRTLLSILGIGLNVLEVDPQAAKIEFVVNSRQIITSYSYIDERFNCECNWTFSESFGSSLNGRSFPLSVTTIEPPVHNDVLSNMQQLLAETNDICGLLSAAKKNQL